MRKFYIHMINYMPVSLSTESIWSMVFKFERVADIMVNDTISNVIYSPSLSVVCYCVPFASIMVSFLMNICF